MGKKKTVRKSPPRKSPAKRYSDPADTIRISREVFTYRAAKAVMRMMGECGIYPISAASIGKMRDGLWRVEAKATLTQLAKFCVAECREQGKSAAECAERIISYVHSN